MSFGGQLNVNKVKEKKVEFLAFVEAEVVRLEKVYKCLELC